MVLNYTDAWKSIKQAQQGFYSPGAEEAQAQMDQEYQENPALFTMKNRQAQRLRNKANKKPTPLGEAPRSLNRSHYGI